MINSSTQGDRLLAKQHFRLYLHVMMKVKRIIQAKPDQTEIHRMNLSVDEKKKIDDDEFINS